MSLDFTESEDALVRYSRRRRTPSSNAPIVADPESRARLHLNPTAGSLGKWTIQYGLMRNRRFTGPNNKFKVSKNHISLD